jgi:hypothetical protein
LKFALIPPAALVSKTARIPMRASTRIGKITSRIA